MTPEEMMEIISQECYVADDVQDEYGHSVPEIACDNPQQLKDRLQLAIPSRVYLVVDQTQVAVEADETYHGAFCDVTEAWAEVEKLNEDCPAQYTVMEVKLFS